jgi:C_GCAxxG_C_C family probable redox protein
MEREEIRKKVYGHFESGFHCAEAISKTVLEMFSEEPQSEVIKAASGFGGGIGGSTEELCGAFTGGIIALSSLVGRENPGENLTECGAHIKAFKEMFLKEFDSLNCQTILTGFSEQGNGANCMELTANAAIVLAEILKGVERTGDMDLKSFSYQPRDKVELGRCPFSASS